MSIGNDDYQLLLNKISDDIKKEEDRVFMEMMMHFIPIEFALIPRDTALNEFLCS
jgi:hypothetical protein